MSQPKKHLSHAGEILPFLLTFIKKRNKIQSPAWEQMSLRILDAMATVSELSDWEFIASCKAFCTPSWQLPKQSETGSIISPRFCHPILNIENPFWWLTFQTVFSHLHSQFFSRFCAIIFATADLPKCFGSQANHPAISAVAIQGSNQCFQRTSLVSMQRKEDYYSVRKLRCHSVWFYLLLLWKLLVSTSSCHETFLKRLLDFHFFWWGHHWDLDRLHFALGGCRIRPSTRIRQNEASPHLNLRVDTEERTEFIVFIPFIQSSSQCNLRI